ncbi:MAG TPA: midcut-by-XrtH protein [Cellvibrionaceae bacterium]
MKYRSLSGLLALLSLLFVSTQAHAVIVSGPLSTLPVNSPLMLIALAVALAALAWWGMRRAGLRSLHSIMLPLLLVSSGVWLAASPALQAQLLVQFTNPKGQSLSLGFSPGIEGNSVFEVANSSGVRLRIIDIQPPEECFVIINPLPLGKADTQPLEKVPGPGYCHVGDILGVNKSCIVDFSFCGEFTIE